MPRFSSRPLLICLFTASAAPAAADERLEECLTRLSERDAAFNPLLARYHLETRYTESWAQLRRDNPGGPTTGSPEIIQAEYARSGSKRRSYSTSLQNGREQVSFAINNGKATLRPASDGGFIITTKGGEYLAVDHPLSLSGEAAILDMLKEWKARRRPIRLLRTERVASAAHGQVLTVHVQNPDTRWHDKWSFALDKGYAVVGQESRNAANDLVGLRTVSRLTDVDGMAYPGAIRHQHYSAGGKLGYTSDLLVDSVTIRPDAVGEALFTHDLPPDSIVFDEDAGVIVRNTGHTQTHLDAIVEGFRPTPRWWQRWTVWVIIVLALFLPAVTVFLRRRWGVRTHG